MRHLTDFRILTFDCYGTLIDWEAGLLAQLRPWVAAAGHQIDDARLLASFARHESAQETETPTLIYRDILFRVHQRIAAELGIPPSSRAAAAFAASVGTWPPFPDSAEALIYLQRHYRLVVLSNVDRRSFRDSERQLGVEFFRVFTAEEIGSYKPDQRNFRFMLDELSRSGFPTRDILHTAQSIHHDLIPASRIGLATNWIDRRHDQKGWGATPSVDALPEVDFHHTSLAEFVERLRAESASTTHRSAR